MIPPINTNRPKIALPIAFNRRFHPLILYAVDNALFLKFFSCDCSILTILLILSIYIFISIQLFYYVRNKIKEKLMAIFFSRTGRCFSFGLLLGFRLFL
jgi:hypothetical protein